MGEPEVGTGQATRPDVRFLDVAQGGVCHGSAHAKRFGRHGGQAQLQGFQGTRLLDDQAKVPRSPGDGIGALRSLAQFHALHVHGPLESGVQQGCRCRRLIRVDDEAARRHGGDSRHGGQSRREVALGSAQSKTRKRTEIGLLSPRPSSREQGQAHPDPASAEKRVHSGG